MRLPVIYKTAGNLVHYIFLKLSYIATEITTTEGMLDPTNVCVVVHQENVK